MRDLVLVGLMIVGGLVALVGVVKIARARDSSPYDFNCKHVGGGGMERCTNNEVICYRYGEGLDCKWK